MGASESHFFLPKLVLSRVFRGKFIAALQEAFRNGPLRFARTLSQLAEPRTFAAWLRPLYRQDWIVYLKRPFGGPQHVLHYLGRYTHRVAISNHRLVSFTGGKVTFRWRDSAHQNQQKLMTLSLDEFLRRFLLHILPKGFVRIRHFGFLANRRRTALLPLCFHRLGVASTTTGEHQHTATTDSTDLYRCPNCGEPMVITLRLTPAELQLRSPPVLSVAA